MAEPMDVDFVLKLCHAFSYALSRSLTETMGEAQGVLFKRYVDSLIPLLRSAGVEFQNLTPEGFCKLLRERGVVESAELVSELPGETTFIIKGCVSAPRIHKPLGMEGYTGDLCPLSMVAMAALALDRGYKEGEDPFKYVRFAERLTYFTSKGSKTKFRLV